MVEKFKSIQDVLNEIKRDYKTMLYSTPISLTLWIDTHQKFCTPILGKLRLDFGGTAFRTEMVLAILLKINKVTPITMILIEGHPFKVYRVTKTEEYMNKSCEVC